MNEPLLTRNEIIGFIIALLVVIAMGVIVFTGPYHVVNKPALAAAYRPVTVKLLSDPRTVGRYDPQTVAVHVGQRITWVNDSNAAHTVDARSGPFHSGNIDPAQSWSYTPTKSGRYPYRCLYHPLMVGTLIVVPAGAKLPSVATQPTSTPSAKPTPTAGHFTKARHASKWLTVNAKAHRVVITVIAADTTANSAFNFDGYANGKANFVVPQGWTVQLKFSNHGSIPHSLAIASGHGNTPPLPKLGGKQVKVRNATKGLTKGHTAVLTFTARPAGKYFLVCLVPGHDVAGMWDQFTVSKHVTAPVLQVR